MRTLAIDLETYSELDIAKVGLYKYAENCKVLLCAYAYDNEPVQIVDLAQGEKLPLHFVEALYHKNVVKTAYNAAFEIQVLNKYLNRPLDSMQWQCTMVQALSLGLPGSLEKVGKVLNIAGDKKKLEIGKKLIKFFSMPKPQQKIKKSQGEMSFEFSLFGEIGDENRNMPKDNLEKWAEAGDGDSMYKLSKIYQAEKEFETASYWLEKSAETKNFFAMQELADNLREEENFNAARELYKEIVENSGDWQAMENLLDISSNDLETLEFILSKIERMYNEIYLRDYQILRRTWDLGTRRHNECTIGYLAAVERRRIASRIRKIWAEN